MSLFRTRNDPKTADSGNCLVMKDSQSESQ